MNKKTIIWAAVILVVIVGAIMIGKSKDRGVIQVSIDQMTNRTIVSTVTANGKIRPEAEVKISADVSGEIIELNVQEGDTVQEGQLLLKINPDLYITARDRALAGLSSSQSSYKSTQAVLTQAEARFSEQEAAFKRSKQLKEDNVISQAEFDAAKAAYLVAQSEVKAANERLASAKYGIDNSLATLNEANKNLGRTSIYSPTDGVVSALNNEKGERVVGTAQMAGTEIMTISNFNNMEVIVDVNENDILEIEDSDTVEIEIDAYNDRVFTGIVTERATSANNISGIAASTDQVTNFEVKIRILKSSYGDLLAKMETPFLPGMSASVEIRTEVKENINCLPIEAVGTRIREQDSTSSDEKLDEVVFSIDNDTAVMHVVTTGIQDTRYIEILTGLEKDQELIVGPYDAVSKKLDQGDKVKVSSKKDLQKLDKE